MGKGINSLAQCEKGIHPTFGPRWQSLSTKQFIGWYIVRDHGCYELAKVVLPGHLLLD